jgi:hypothetical protein
LADTEPESGHGLEQLMSVKIEALVEEIPETFQYGNFFVREDVGGRDRLRVGLNEAQDICVRRLASTRSGPFQLLYVLHTTRTGAELGRYESPELTSADMEEFLKEFGRFFCEDSRHDLWVRSHDDDATIVLDRHNLIYAYGPLDAFEAALQSLGARKGEPAVLGAHVHHYYPAWDEAERRVLQSFEWDIKPLRSSDVQFDSQREREH